MVLADTVVGMRRDWRLVCGLASLFLWTWLHYWGGCYSLRAYSIDIANMRWAANAVMCAVVMGAIAFASLKDKPNAAKLTRISVVLQWMGCICGVLGSALALVLVVFPSFEGVPLMVTSLASGIFTGAAEASFLCLWCVLTSHKGVRVSLTCNVVALLVSGALFIVCNVCPVWISQVVGLICPVGGLACAVAMRRQTVEVFADGDARPVAVVAHVEPLSAPLIRTLLSNPSFKQLVSIALVFSVSCGFVNASFALVPAELYRTSCHFVVVGTVFAAVLAVVTAFLLKMSAWQLVFRLSLPFMALAYFLMPHAAYALAGPGVHALGYQYFFISFWPLLGSPQIRRDLPALCTVSAGLFVAEAGQAFGLGMWNIFAEGALPGSETLVYISGAGMLLALVAAVVFERPSFGWGPMRLGVEVSVDVRNDFDLIIEHMRERYKLTAREAEVLGYLGRGRNRQYIADELSVSLETAKSHATNIYRKVGVHSQQELLDVLDMIKDELNQIPR